MNPSLSLYPLGEAQTNWLLCAKINKLKKEKKSPIDSLLVAGHPVIKCFNRTLVSD